MELWQFVVEVGRRCALGWLAVPKHRELTAFYISGKPQCEMTILMLDPELDIASQSQSV